MQVSELRIQHYEQIQQRGHGSPYDRGSADSYYRRYPEPHWYPGGTRPGAERVAEADMSDFEIAEYWRGYQENEQIGDHKDWS